MFITSKIKTTVLAVALLSSTQALADVLAGRVVRVIDGDTISVLDDTNHQHRIRIAGIDAPEFKQAFGQAARRHLASLVAGKPVSVEWSKRDRYGRIVGKVVQTSTDVGLDQIRVGLAWHYKKYEREQSFDDRRLYAQAETAAREQRLGLWSSPKSTAPWAFRRKPNDLAGAIEPSKIGHR